MTDREMEFVPGLTPLTDLCGLWFKKSMPVAKDAPPILFVHGMWGWHWIFSNFIETFSTAGYDCYALDLFGHGPSFRPSPPAGNVSLDDYVRQTKNALEYIAGSHQGIPPLIVAHSMGGIVMQKVLESTIASAAVLIASAVPKGILVLPPLRTLWILAKYIMKSFFRRQIKPGNDELIYMVFHQINGTELMLALQRCVPEFSRAYRQVLLAQTRIDAGKIKCPILVLGGSEDRMILQKSNLCLAEKYDAQIKIFDRRSHWLVREEGWNDVCQYILTWFEKDIKNNRQGGK